MTSSTQMWALIESKPGMYTSLGMPFLALSDILSLRFYRRNQNSKKVTKMELELLVL